MTSYVFRFSSTLEFRIGFTINDVRKLFFFNMLSNPLPVKTLEPVIYFYSTNSTGAHAKSMLMFFFQTRPINLSQRASPAPCTVMTRCAMAHQIPRLLTRCCDARMKVLSADMETAQDMASLKPLTQLEVKMVSPGLVPLLMRACMHVLSKEKTES